MTQALVISCDRGFGVITVPAVLKITISFVMARLGEQLIALTLIERRVEHSANVH